MSKLWALFVRDARMATTYRYSFVLSWIAIPISVVSLWFVSRLVPPSNAFGDGSAPAAYFAFALVNVAFLTLQTAALQAFDHSVRDAQMLGTLEGLLSMPVDEETVVLGSAVWPIVLAVVQVAWYLLWAVLLGLRFTHVDLPALALFAALAVLASAPFGIVSAAFVLAFKQGVPTSFLIGGAASLVGGVLFPIAVLPGWLQHVAWWLPIAHALTGIRGAMYGLPRERLLPDALWLGAAAAVLLPLALAALRASARRARYDGTLGQY